MPFGASQSVISLSHIYPLTPLSPSSKSALHKGFWTFFANSETANPRCGIRVKETISFVNSNHSHVTFSNLRRARGPRPPRYGLRFVDTLTDY